MSVALIKFKTHYNTSIFNPSDVKLKEEIEPISDSKIENLFDSDNIFPFLDLKITNLKNKKIEILEMVN